ncbi:sensor histidine kinase [Brevundimonas sp.]
MTSASPAARPLLHRLIMAGHLRYWLIASWGLALLTVVPPVIMLGWLAVALASGVARTVVETKLTLGDTRLLARLRLATATLSCIAWAAAPMLAITEGGEAGLVLAVALLLAGYVLVFTQMRAAPAEALIVSSPYTVVTGTIFIAAWGTEYFWPMVAIVPVVGLALLIKVVITQLKDAELEEVNRRQGHLITKLQAASETKSRFLAVISHELRTPMNGVLGAAHLLQASGLSDRQIEFARVIQSSGQDLMVLLNDLLDISKMEAGKLELSPEVVDTVTLEQRLVGPFRAQAEARGLSFSTQVLGDLPAQLRLDPLRLTQIVHNLLSNAIKFTPQGGVTLTIEASAAGAEETSLSVHVKDSGIGITAEDQTRLFEPFSQVDDSSTRRFGGTGLGLSICRKLAELMGGRIEIASTPGEGSTFSVRILARNTGLAMRQAA